MKKIIYIDMDNVLVDFKTGISKLSKNTIEKFEGHLDDVPGIFNLMEPMKGSIEAFNELSQSEKYDVYILSTAPWDNPTAWSDKLEWVKKYLGKNGYKRLILSHHKNLNAGDYLIDDRTKNGADKFKGEHIHFGQDQFPAWDQVLEFFK